MRKEAWSRDRHDRAAGSLLEKRLYAWMVLDTVSKYLLSMFGNGLGMNVSSESEP